MKQTIVINLHAGSGCGKTTVASEVFVELKKQNKSVELVHEYVKGWAWEGRNPTGLENSIYIFAKQLRRESILYGKVDYIVTDSPLGGTVAYEEFYLPHSNVIRTLYAGLRNNQDQVKHLDLHLMRQHGFVKEGRYETEDQARRIDQILRNRIPGNYVNSAKDVLEALVHFEMSLV